MTTDARAAAAPAGPLSRALDQSEHVQDEIERAAVGLGSVNATLKDEVGAGITLAEVEHALTKSEAIEVKVQEAADELVVVNGTLAEEIDERRHLERELSKTESALAASRADAEASRHAALHDPLTGLPNSTLFDDRLANALAQADRRASRLAVMFIDLDDFKRVNDTFGHQIGDRVLTTVARRLESLVRGGDSVCRRSGDEFLCLMVDAKDASNVSALALRIADGLARPCEIDGVSLSLTASVGVAIHPEHGRSAKELLAHADAAMYAAKKGKRAVPG